MTDPLIDIDANDDSGDEATKTDDANSDEQSSAHVLEHNGEKIEVPENFRNEDGTPNVAAILKSQTDLRKQVGEKPAPPEKYELNVPEALQEVIKPDNDNPMVAPVMEWAKKHGISQQAFDELTASYYGQMAPDPEADKKHAEMETAKLKDSLGDNMKGRLDEIGKWTGAVLGDLRNDEGVKEAITALTTSASGVMVLDKIMRASGERTIPSGKDGGSRPALSQDDIRALQGTDAYWNSSHPEHSSTVKRVKEGLAALTGENTT